ncbi:Phosphoribulokinase/uridine kinase, partial [human gut metagenome]
LLIMLEVPEHHLITRLIRRHKSFGRTHADAAHWVRAVDVPNSRLVAACAGRCDEVWHLEEQD